MFVSKIDLIHSCQWFSECSGPTSVVIATGYVFYISYLFFMHIFIVQLIDLDFRSIPIIIMFYR